MWHHFELTHSQPLAVQRRVTLSAEEWNYLQLSVIGAASTISLIVSTISQRSTNGDGFVGTYVPPHCVWVGGKDWKLCAPNLKKLLIPSLSWRTMIFGGQVPPAERLTRLLCSDKRTRTSRFLEIETLSGLQWWQLEGKAQEMSQSCLVERWLWEMPTPRLPTSRQFWGM